MCRIHVCGTQHAAQHVWACTSACKHLPCSCELNAINAVCMSTEAAMYQLFEARGLL